jgi:hypothetical protein
LSIAHRKGNEALLCAGRAAGLLAFLLRTQEAMLAVHPTTPPDTQRPDPQAHIQVLAERVLHSSRYQVLKTLSSDWQDGVLVLRGCLPTYYLKQMAQEAVAHRVKGMSRRDDQFQVIRPTSR